MANILITGTNRGIGLELAKQSLTAGHRVWATARKLSEAHGLQKLQREFPEHLQLSACDVGSDEDVAKLLDAYGNNVPLDALINNAGVLLDYGARLADLSLEAVRDSFEINVLGPLRLTRAFFPNLQKAAAAKVINMTSLMGSISDNTSGGAYAYRMSKTALNMFTKSLSFEDPKVTCIVMHPGWVQTDMGGQSAPTSPQTSAAGILKVLEGLKTQDSGKFFDYRGRELTW